MSKEREYLNQYYEIYTKSSSTVSELNRKLVYAGFAIIWIFRISSNDSFGSLDNASYKFELPPAFHWSIVFLVGSLILDFIHYFFQSLSIKHYLKVSEAKLDANGSFDEYEEDEIIINIFWWAKIGMTFIAYLIILYFVIDNIK